MSRRYPVTLTPKRGRSSSSTFSLQKSSSSPEAERSNGEVESDLSLVGRLGSDVGMNRMMAAKGKTCWGDQSQSHSRAAVNSEIYVKHTCASGRSTNRYW